MKEYNFSINDFEGPLDLLLHLIKKENINIWDVNIVEIIEQYFEYINQAKKLNLNIASEYLVMAAELLEIKSISLLPKKEIEELEEDPKEKLINKLIEYNQYKKVIPTFEELKEKRKDVYTKEPDNMKNIKQEFTKNETSDINLLINAFNTFLKKLDLKKPLHTTITEKEYSIQERNKEIKKILREKKQVKFLELFDKLSKSYLIITFLSILDLTKKREILIEQNNNFEDIILKKIEVI